MLFLKFTDRLKAMCVCACVGLRAPVHLVLNVLMSPQGAKDLAKLDMTR